MIRIDGVTWEYPNSDAPSIRDLSLVVAAGECVVLCGASGSGKSTVLRLLNGLIPHFHEEGLLQGTVTVEGRVTTDTEIDELGLRTGTVLQHPRRQFFADTVREEPELMRERVDDALANIEASAPVGQRLQHLSGGQQQQVAIAAATAHHPAVVLLDEPSSNLSADAVERLVETIRTLKSRGTTIVIAEHRLRYLEPVADRILFMRNGTITREWSAREFHSLSDAQLEQEGLRGAPRQVDLPAAVANGRSVRSSATHDTADISAAGTPRLELRPVAA